MKCGYSERHQPGGVEIRKDKGGVFPAQKLEMSLEMSHNLEFKMIRESAITGMRTFEYRGTREAWEAFRGYCLTELGGDPVDLAREARMNARGRFTWRCGLGYDVVSADLLGGKADGKEHRELIEAGFRVRLY